jgi:protein ImuB
VRENLITCVLLPRFELGCAAGTRTELLGIPAAVAPEPGSQLIGAVSAAAEAFGIVAGMRLGEALARCPKLTLIPPDPAGVADAFERMLTALESIGAGVEPLVPGVACFDARGLLRLHGGGRRSDPAADYDPGRDSDSGRDRRPFTPTGEDLTAVLTVARRALAVPARFGVAPTRFAAVAAATQARARRPLIVPGGARLSWPFCRRPSSGSGSAPSVSWRRCRVAPWPIVSVPTA